MGGVVNKTDAGAPLRQIRFVNNQGQPPSKRRRINAACLTCRRRKTRCAGERPKCSTCTKNGHRCLGYPEETRRETEGSNGGAVGDIKTDVDDDYDYDELATERPVSRADDTSDNDHNDERASKRSRMAANSTSESPHTSPRAFAKKPPSAAMRDIDEYRAANDHKPPPQRLHRQQHSSPARPSDSNGSVDIQPDDLPTSPTIRRSQANNHRVPYFRYFGPTAIVPGFKQMVVSVRDRRRSTGGSHSGTSPMSTPNNLRAGSSAGGSDVVLEELPVYDVNDSAPVHPLILSLVKTFFTHVGCNYPFLKRGKFLRAVQDKRVEPILVDAVCALAARFSDAPILCGGNDKMPRTERGQVYAQRAKQATVDTFPCPTVGAVQACLLMAYEGFGANQDSALWMYLGLAIRMAVDLGLQKRVGIQYQGEKDPWNHSWNRTSSDMDSPEEKKSELSEIPTLEEQKEVEQERIDTFWTVFVLDRLISSGTGRPVTIRDEDFDLAFPAPTIDPSTGWPRPFPVFLEIIHLYGRVCDVLNNIHDRHDLTPEKWEQLGKMESQVTIMYKGWDQRLQFSVENFKAYLRAGQGTTFILLHFWFHALFIILHQPTLITPFGDLRSELRLLPDSRELSMSSAKTICDILAFADLIDAKSFIGNPFTSQPIYIAACAFLMESSVNASEEPSREASPSVTMDQKPKIPSSAKHSRHSLLASAANQYYQRCYNSMQHLHIYWGGVKYILTALDQKSKGIWDCETYTSEEYESTKIERRESSIGSQFPRFDGKASPKIGGGPPPIAWCVSGTADSSNSNLTVMYQNNNNGASSAAPASRAVQAPVPAPAPTPAVSTPPGNMIYDPIRAHVSETGSMLPPTTYPQPTTSAIRHTSPRHPQSQRPHNLTTSFESSGLGSGVDRSDGGKVFVPSGYTPTSQHSSGTYDTFGTSPGNNQAAVAAAAAAGVTATSTPSSGNGLYYQPQGLASSSAYQAPWGSGVMGNMDAITFDSQDINFESLGLQQPDMMTGWWEYIQGDVLGLFENQDAGHNGPGPGPGP
jgi:hypothetical protein